MDPEQRLYADLDGLGIAYEVAEHEAVYTVAESERLYEVTPGAHVKNLFLKDAGDRFWLLTVPARKRVALKGLPAAIGCRKVSFGKPEDMARLIGVTPGSVTPLAAINDVGGEVSIVLDVELADVDRINVHPLRNTATLGLPAPDLIRALSHWRHAPQIAEIPAVAETA